MSIVRLDLPRRHSGQERVAREARRFNVLACGRRWGKTTFGIDREVGPVLAGYPVGWFSPTYKMLAEVWRDMRLTLEPIASRINAQEHRIELVTGGVVDMWSLDQPNAARGRRYKRVVIDEAAMVRELKEAWQAVIRPTLTDFEGDAWFKSTPKGLNYFYDLYSLGQDPLYPDWMSWQMPTLTNPHILAAEVESARQELPDRVFRQEYEATFLQDDGAVFRRISENLTAPEGSDPRDHAEHYIVMGVDWGRDNDFTALSVVCSSCRREVALDRFNKIEWAFQRARLRALADLWRVRYILAESNSIGEPNIEALQSEGLPVAAFQTTAQSKPPLVQSLALALEQGEAAWLPDKVAKAELESYEGRRSEVTGRVQYGAPSGKHDDTVIARCLAWRAALSGGPALGREAAEAWAGVGAV